MTIKAIEQNIQKLSKKIVKEYRPEKIILFGSHAWGRPGKYSDVDLFVLKDSKKNTLQMMREVNQIIFERSIPVDVLVYTPEQVKKRAEMGDPFLKKIFTFGKLLYERPKTS